MSKEHQTFNATVKCKNTICQKKHTAILEVHKAKLKKITCPCCGWKTAQRDLNIIQIFKP